MRPWPHSYAVKVLQAIRNTGLSKSMSFSPGRNVLGPLKQCNFNVDNEPKFILIRISICEVLLNFKRKILCFGFATGAGRWICNGRTMKHSKNIRSAAQTASNARYSQAKWNVEWKEDLWTNMQVPDCLLCCCEQQINGCSMNRTSVNFGFPERSLFRTWLAKMCERCLPWYWTERIVIIATQFSARSVGSATKL